MIISDSLPIQFWINGQQTYNEKELSGVYKACFKQPFECGDEIVIQVSDTSAPTFLIIDKNDEVITTLPFEEIASGTWQVSFVPSELSPSLCQEVYFKIVDNSQVGSLSGFTNQAGGGSTWTLGATPSITLGGTSVSDYLIDEFPSKAGYTYNIGYNANFGIDGANMFIYFLDDDFNELNIVTLPVFNTGINSGSVNITPSANGSYIAIRLLNGGIVNTFTLLSLTKNSPDIIDLAKSDCVDLQNSHECTELITYTNTKDFDGINYKTSPPPVFNIRVPAQFWKEDNPQTQEDSVLSNGVIVTRRHEIQEKTLLEIGYLPNYMHKKIQKILMHNSVKIEDVNGDLTYWKKRDSYESENLDRYPLKMAQVWLTKYNSVEKNTI